MKQRAGFSTLELILAIALFAVLVLVLASSLAYRAKQLKQSGEEAKAIFLMDEALEATAHINSRSFVKLSAGGHGLINNGGVWDFANSEDLVDNYTRSVTILPVDANTVDAVAEISWASAFGGVKKINATERLTNYNRSNLPDGWATPAITGNLNITGSVGGGLRIAYKGTSAYLIKNAGSPNFAAVNFSDPKNPTQLWTLNINGTPHDLQIAGNYAYVSLAVPATQIVVVDLNSHAIIKTITLPAGQNLPGNLYVSDNQLYVAYGRQLLIYNALNFNLTGSLTFPETVTLNSVVVSGSWAYLATSADNGELAVVDVANPATPQFKVALDLTGNIDAKVIAKLNNTLFLGRDMDSSVYVIDVTSPLVPSQKSLFDTTGVPYSFSFGAPLNNYLYVASSHVNKDFQVVNISNLNALDMISTVNTPYALNAAVYVPGIDKVLGVSSNFQGEFLVISPKK